MDRPHVLACASSRSGTAPCSDSVPRGRARDPSVAQPNSVPARLNLPAIESFLKAVQEDFARINHTLNAPRDILTEEVRTNMMAGYRFVDDALARELDLFEPGHSQRLLEMNTLVLCGTDEHSRKHHARHIALTEQRFYEQEGGGIGAFMEWLQRHRGDDVWTRSAGAYIHILSRPQLYIEGNHRAGALIMSSMLAHEGRPPFVLCVKNAKAYFDPSALVKEAKKRGLRMLIRVPRLRKRFAELLKEHADERYLLPPHCPP